MNTKRSLFTLVALVMVSLTACSIGQEIKDDLSSPIRADVTNEGQSKKIILMKYEVIADASQLCTYAVFVENQDGLSAPKCVGQILGPAVLRLGNHNVSPDEGIGAQLATVLPLMDFATMTVVAPSAPLIAIARRVIVRIGTYEFTLYNTTCSQVYSDWFNCGGINIPLSGNGSSLFPYNGNLSIFCYEANGNCQITLVREADENLPTSSL